MDQDRPSGPTYGWMTLLDTTISPEVGVAGGGKEGVQPPPTNQPKTGNQPNREEGTWGSGTPWARGPANLGTIPAKLIY